MDTANAPCPSRRPANAAIVRSHRVLPACGRDMVAKCGDVRVHHWAHRGRQICDSWWEPETEWHRAWKNRFDLSWQEVIGYDEASGEKHIADIRTSQGLVIEFQHSYLRVEERAAREAFRGNMVWVVDGTRVPRDRNRFDRPGNAMERGERPGEFTVYYPDECFSENWLGSSVPVFFDFLGVAVVDDDDYSYHRDTMWCLLPRRGKHGYRKALAMPRGEFLAAALSKPAVVELPPVEPDPPPAKSTSYSSEAMHFEGLTSE